MLRIIVQLYLFFRQKLAIRKLKSSAAFGVKKTTDSI